MSQQVRAAALLRQAAEILDVTQPCSSTISCATTTTNVTACNSAQVAVAARGLFGPYRNSRPFQRTALRRGARVEPSVSYWTHKFSVVPRCKQETVPNREEKFKLHSAGLGEKRLAFIKNSNKNDFESTLEEAYPKLKDCGGYELMRTPPGSRVTLESIMMPTGGFTSAYLADESNLGQAICYIRPIQKDLDLGILSTEPSEPSQECLSCGERFPLNLLREHVERCQFAETGVPPEKIRRMSVQTPVCQFTCTSTNSRNVDGLIDTCTSNTERKKVEFEMKEKCPICCNEFSVLDLEVHAATCGEKPVLSKVETESELSLQEFLETKLSGDKFWDIAVVRKYLVKQAMEEMESTEDENWQKKLNINFIGEEGIDSGGLTREFLTLLFKGSPLFENGVLSLDSDALRRKHNYLMGKMVALGLLNGHPGPRNLKPHLVSFILKGEVTEPSKLPDISRGDAAAAIVEISDQSKESAYLLEKYGDILEASGFKHVVSDTNRTDAVYALKSYYLFNTFLPAMLQYIEGLKLHGVLAMLQKHSEGACFLMESRVEMEAVKGFFKPIYSADESEKADESMVVYNFYQFLKKLQRGQVSADQINVEDGSSETITLTLEHLLQALVGCTTIPDSLSMGIISFDHKSDQLSTVNTCAPSITFCRIGQLRQYPAFQDMMGNIIIGSYGFGQK